MKKLVVSIVSAFAAVSLYGGIAAYIITAQNNNSTGVCGEIVGVQACSTNATGTASVQTVTALSIGGKNCAFTNDIASVTLVDGVKSVNTNGLFVASKQKIYVSGTAFPGGAVTIWIKD